jgi:diketogulonate reductase-like aldo/keto reductase
MMPGYGTFPAPFIKGMLDYGRAARDCQPYVEQALRIGYRHIDTAFTYRNQDLVGAAIRHCAISRGEVFVTSKLHPDDNTYENAQSRIQEAIALIWGDQSPAHDRFLDAFLLHYPGRRNPVAAWKALLEARDRGLVKHAGVSNFEIWHLQKLRKFTGVYPEINQVEFHPLIYWEQRDLLKFCKHEGIAVEGYSPLAQGAVFHAPELETIAAAYKTSPGRVVLRWCMQHGVRPIVGTRSFQHLTANGGVYTFALSGEHMSQLDSLGCRRPVKVSLKWHWNPKTAPFGSSGWKSAARAFLRRIKRVFRSFIFSI